MRLARKHEHDRPVLGRNELLEPAQVGEKQRRAFVRREAAAKTYDQHVRVFAVDEPQKPVRVRFAEPVTLILHGQSLAQHAQHLTLDPLTRLPVELVRNVENAIHQRAVHQPLAPVVPQMLVEQRGPGVAQERADMHAVRHVTNRVFRRRYVRPHALAQP